MAIARGSDSGTILWSKAAQGDPDGEILSTVALVPATSQNPDELAYLPQLYAGTCTGMFLELFREDGTGDGSVDHYPTNYDYRGFMPSSPAVTSSGIVYASCDMITKDPNSGPGYEYPPDHLSRGWLFGLGEPDRYKTELRGRIGGLYATGFAKWDSAQAKWEIPGLDTWEVMDSYTDPDSWGIQSLDVRSSPAVGYVRR